VGTAETEAEAERGAVIWGAIIIRIRVRIVGRAVIDRRRRRRIVGRIAVARRRRRRGVGLVHAGIIGVGIVALDIAGGAAGIVGADGAAGEQAGARADGCAGAGIAGGAADDGAKRGAAQGAANGTARLFVACRLARRGVAGTAGGIVAAEQIAVALGLLVLLRPGRRGVALIGCRRR